MAGTGRWICSALLIFLFLFMSWTGHVGARGLQGASQELTDSVQKLAVALSQDGQIPPEVTAALRDLTSAVLHLAEAVQEQPEVALVQAQAGKPEPPRGKIQALAEQFEGLTEKVSLYGDFRLREEKDTHRDGDEERNRVRTRLRLGGNYKVTDELTFGARLSTGNPSDAQSPHQNLGGGHNVGGSRGVFGRFDFNLDRAFLTYRPTWAKGFWLTGGKFSHPFKKPAIYNELVWDGDVQPEGIAVGYTLSNLGPLAPFIDSVNLVAGEYLILEHNSGRRNDDMDMQVYQLAANKKFGGGWSTTAAAGFYNFGNTEKNGSNVILGHNSGNSVAGRDSDGDGVDDLFGFDSAFHIIDTFVNLQYSGWKVPLIFSGQYFNNPGADARDSEDDGFAVGLAIGKAKKRGNWQAYYQYQVVEQDAVFSPISQDDWMASTNLRGHVGGIKYRLFDKVTFHLWGLLHQREDSTPSQSEQTQSRFRADVNVSF